MTPDDYTYAILLIISMPLAYFMKCLRWQLCMKLFNLMVGLGFMIFTSGWNTFHHLISFYINYKIIKGFDYKNIHIYSFIWSFLYLAFFRLCPNLGLPDTGSFSNAIQLFLTLKMVGMAVEFNETKMSLRPAVSRRVSIRNSESDEGKEGKSEESDVQEEISATPPSFLDIFSYGFSFIGLFTGPYYRLRTYLDMIESDYDKLVPRFRMVFSRMMTLPLLALAYFCIGYFYSLEDVRSGLYKNYSFFQRFLYMMAIFTIFRARLYMAWIAAESACILSCLGVYPEECMPLNVEGPARQQFELWGVKREDVKKNSKFNSTTIQCFDFNGCELAHSTRIGMKSWNMTVQTWLAHTIHKRTRHVENQNLRTLLTMLVSAYWHGFHPGYYLSFMIIPFCFVAETSWVLIFSRTSWSRDDDVKQLFQYFLWFFKMRMFDYMCMGFLLKTFEETIDYWSSIYFCGHVYVILSLILSYLAPTTRSLSIVRSRIEVN